MLRRRYYPKKETAGKAEGRQTKNASVWNGSGAERSVPRCSENGFINYTDKPDHTGEAVCFTGHRVIDAEDLEPLRGRLQRTIRNLYENGYRTFLSGGALGFDMMAAEAVLSCREFCPDIRLKMVIPCRGQSSRWAAKDRTTYESILHRADETVCLSEEYYKGCMLMRNRYLVAHASQCVCYLKDRKGGTSYTVACAWREGLKIINLAVPD